MKVVRWALLGLAAASLLGGCKGFWDPLPGGGGGGSASGVFYIISGSEVIGYSFASGSTTPTAITNGSATFTATPQAMTISPNGGFLYVSAGGIFAYAIGSGGTLTAVNNGNNGSISSDLPTAMAVDGSGAWLIESLSGSGVLNAIPISSSTGELDTTRNEKSVNLPSTTLTQIAVSPANSTSPYIFAAMGAGGTAVIPFTASSTGNPFGSVAKIGLKSSQGAAAAVAVDPTNRLLYVGETSAIAATQSQPQTGGLRVFTVSSSAINEVTGSPYPTEGTGPSAILPDANGSFVYVANKAVANTSAGNVTGYPINISAGKFSLGTIINTVTTGANTGGLAEESTKTYVLAVNAGGSPDLNTFTFDATTSGKLDSGQTVSSSLDPAAIVAVP